MAPIVMSSVPTIHYPDSGSSIASRRSRTRHAKRSQLHPHSHQHQAHRKTSAFSPRASHPLRHHNVSGSHGHRHHNTSSSHYHHSVPTPPHIHTHIRHPARRHQSLIKPFLVRAPRTPPPSPLVSKTPSFAPAQRPWTPAPSFFDDASSFHSGSRDRSSSPAFETSANAKQSQRRTLRHAVRSLLSNITWRRQREDDDLDDEGDAPPLAGLATGAPLRPHRSPGAESFYATSGRVALEPTRSSSPTPRNSTMTVEDSPIRPHLILRPRTRRLPDRLVSRFSDSSDDNGSDGGHSGFSLTKHAKQSFHPLLRGRKWSSVPSLTRGPLQGHSPTPERRGKSLDL